MWHGAGDSTPKKQGAIIAGFASGAQRAIKLRLWHWHDGRTGFRATTVFRNQWQYRHYSGEFARRPEEMRRRPSSFATLRASSFASCTNQLRNSEIFGRSAADLG